MRKGQEKLIKRAEELLPKEFVEKLMDESFTIEQLESLFRWMLVAYKNRYSIKQLYGVCNSEPEAGVEDYVKGFLAE